MAENSSDQNVNIKMKSGYVLAFSKRTLMAACFIVGIGFFGNAISPVQAKTTEQAKDIAPDEVTLISFSGAFLAGRAADSDMDLDAAVTFYKKALQFDPANLGIQQALLLTYLSQGDLASAMPYAEALKDEPEIDRMARLVLGINALKARQYSKAQTVLALNDPSDLDRLINGIVRAWASAGAGKAEDGIKALNALEGPQWFEPFQAANAAMIAEMAGLKDIAQKTYTKLVEDPDATGAAPDAYLRAVEAYAIFLARNDKKDQALKILENGIAIAPGRPMFSALKTAIEAGTPQKPLIADASQGAAEALFGLAMAINRQGAEPFVRRFLNMSLFLAPKRDAYLYELGRLEERDGRTEIAVQNFEAVDQKSSLHTLAWMQAALNLADLDRNDEAKQRLQTLIAEDPSNNRAYLALGAIFSSSKDFQSAATLYSQALEANPDAGDSFWNIYYYRGISYERLKEWDKAEPDFREALKRNPDHPQVLNYLGYSLIDRDEKLEEALEMVKRAVELAPDDGYIIDSLGWAYYKMGDYEKAVETLERAIALMPGDPVINDHLGDAFWKVGRTLEARFQWNHANVMEPDEELKLQLKRKLETGTPLDVTLETPLAETDKPAAETKQGG